MNVVWMAMAVILLLTLIGGLVRVARGPTPPDRMLAAQLMGTIGVGVLLLLSQALNRQSLVDVALVFSLLATVVSVVFVRRGIVSHTEGEQHDVVE